MPPPVASRPYALRRLSAEGERSAVTRDVAAEVPVALEVNGLGYAVLMATPTHLIDLATGFLLADRLVTTAAEIEGIEEHAVAGGILLRTEVSPSHQQRLLDRIRHRITESSCGLCGVENLEQALRPLPPVTQVCAADDAAIFAALAALRAHQPLGAATGAVHAAALCAADGTVRCVREDVGRHNAFDKLIGAMAREQRAWDGGFALLTSRCSYELVEKAALAGCPLLATISAPTTLALDRAREAGLRLVVLARSDAVLEA